MQETIPEHLLGESDLTKDMEKQIRREFFSPGPVKQMINKMDGRLKELTGEVLLTRRRVGRNEFCPCGSGKKFKKCCIDKVPNRQVDAS